MPPTTVRTNPTEFRGYPVDLLRGLKGLGPALVDNPALYAAAQEYNDSATPGGAGSLGPAMLTEDCNITVTSSTMHTVPEAIAAPKVTPVREPVGDDPWAAHDLTDLLELVRINNVEVPGRVKTPGKLIAALEAAGVKP